MSSRKRANTDTPAAVRWFNRLRMKGPTALSPVESAKWARWSADRVHLAEFERVEALWDDLKHLRKPRLPTQQELDVDRYDPDELSVSEWLERNR
jgi:ferric-dicitrate binding protein FerR (iron transport regulator)